MSEYRATTLMTQALALIKQGRIPAAEERLARLCEDNANDAKAWFLRGALKAKAGDPSSAIEYLTTAVRLVPENTQAQFTLCKLHHARGNAAAAIDHAEKVIAHEPDHAHAWLALGSLYADSGRFAQSEQASRVAIGLLPDVPEPKINLANVLISQRKHEEALVLLDAIKASGPCGAGIWHSLGLAFKTLGRSADAEQCLTTLVELAPNHAQACCALGELKAARGELSKAFSLYERAKNLAPTDPMVHFQMAKVLLPLSSQRHARSVARLQEDYEYPDSGEALDIARGLATDFRYGDLAVAPALVRFFDGFDPTRVYPFDWWIDALKQLGEPGNGADTALRSVFSAVFSFSLPSGEALAQLASFCGTRIASYGSGAGYWEWLLAHHYGVDVSCHDITLRHRFLPVLELSHADVEIDSDDTIFLAWLPGDAAIDLAIESLLGQMRPGQKLVLVGEPDDNGYPRTCGTQRFFRYLRNNFETASILPLPNYGYLKDCVELLVRRSA